MKNWFQGLKLNQKFVLVTLCCIFVPVFISLSFGFESLKKNAMDKSINEAVTATDLACSEINGKADMCLLIADTFQDYEPLQEYLLKIRLGEEISESYYQQFRSNSISILERIQESNSNLYKIRVYAMNDNFLEQQPILYHREKMKSTQWNSQYFVDGQWFFNITEKNEKNPSENSKVRLMVYVADLKDSAGEKIGVIEISMKMSDVFPEIYRSNDREWACFVDEDRKLYDCEKTSAACKWQSYRGLILFRSGIRTEQETQQNAVIGRENVTIVSRRVEKLHGSLVTLTSLDDATGNLLQQQKNILVIAAFCGLLLILVVNLVVRSLLREFYDILHVLRRIDNGATKIHVPCYHTEEIRDMGYGLNGMLERIQKQTEESIQREALLKDTAIRAMQNQINAHFIYNVLESVKMMAEIDEEYTISDAVTALGEMLHYNMRWNTFLVTVQDEMQYIQNYVELMNLRYDFEITLSVHMPEFLYKQDIPKMSLQPVVENAITHGIEELDEDAVIYIKGIEHEESFEIEITDTGKGMTEEQLQILRRKLKVHLNSDQTQKHGIGLRNVQDRIHIQFGMEYGLEIYAKENCYTKVSIHLPITQGQFLRDR